MKSDPTTQNEVDEIRKQLFRDIPEIGIGEALDKVEAAITKLILKKQIEALEGVSGFSDRRLKLESLKSQLSQLQSNNEEVK